jgi:hypothetical protein
VAELTASYLGADSARPLGERIKSLPKALQDAYAGFRQNGRGEPAPSPGSTDDVIYSVTIWYTSERQIQIRRVESHAVLGGGPPMMSYRDVTEDLSRKFYIEGQTDFVLAAVRRSDPRFVSFKSDSDIQTVWTSESAGAISQAVAERFGRKLIRATSEFHHLVATSPALVSPESDCSLMSPTRGFEWLH